MTLKTGSAEDVRKMFGRLTRETEQIVKHIIQLTYYMRGSISYDYLLKEMCFAERQLVDAFLTKRLEEERKSQHPVY